MWRCGVFLLAVLPLCAETWTRFRGPNGAGIATGAGTYPTQFDANRNVIWSRPIAPGKSSPVLTANFLFLTAEEGDKLVVLCVDRKTGKTVWERSIGRPRREFRHSLNSGAASSPATDGENVYAFFADFGLISYDRNGKERWRKPLGPFTSLWGMAASPVLSGGAVVLQMDGLGESSIAAYEQRTGKLRWTMPRPPFVLNYTTPFVRRTGGSDEIVTTGSGRLIAYDTETGAERWSKDLPGGSTVASAGFNENFVFAVNHLVEAPPGFDSQLKGRDKNKDGILTPDEFGEGETARVFQGIGAAYGNKDGAVEASEWSQVWGQWGGKPAITAMRLGDRDQKATASAAPAWSYPRNLPRAPTPLFWEGLVYFVANSGILTALKADSGEVAKTGRLEGALDNYYASPVVAGGNLYFASENGKIVVVKPGADWRVLTVNDLGEECYATPAMSEGKIFVRTAARLYSFGLK